MPATQIAYLTMVVAAFVSFMATLAWGAWFTRNRCSDARQGRTGEVAAEPDAARRAA